MNQQLKKYIDKERAEGEEWNGTVACPKCFGYGYYCDWGERYTCESCKGTGRISTQPTERKP